MCCSHGVRSIHACLCRSHSRAEDNTANLHSQISSALAEQKYDEAQNACSELVSAINTTNADVSSTTAWMANAVLNAVGSLQYASVGSNVPAGVSAMATASNGASVVSLNSVEVTANSASDVTIKLDASMAQQSPLGVRLSVTLPASLFNGVTLNQSSLHLLYQADNGEVQTLNTILTMEQTADAVTLTFWVPHFSTYYITTSATIPSGTTSQSGASSNVTSNNSSTTSTASNGGSNGSTTSASTSTSTATNPIKSTGADMSTAVVFLAMAATAALACGVVVAKKNGLNI